MRTATWRGDHYAEVRKSYYIEKPMFDWIRERTGWTIKQTWSWVKDHVEELVGNDSGSYRLVYRHHEVAVVPVYRVLPGDEVFERPSDDD